MDISCQVEQNNHLKCRSDVCMFSNKTNLFSLKFHFTNNFEHPRNI